MSDSTSLAWVVYFTIGDGRPSFSLVKAEKQPNTVLVPCALSFWSVEFLLTDADTVHVSGFGYDPDHCLIVVPVNAETPTKDDDGTTRFAAFTSKADADTFLAKCQARLDWAVRYMTVKLEKDPTLERLFPRSVYIRRYCNAVLDGTPRYKAHAAALVVARRYNRAHRNCGH